MILSLMTLKVTWAILCRS